MDNNDRYDQQYNDQYDTYDQYDQNSYYNQGSYYDQGNSYDQGSYYDQGTTYDQSGYYSQPGTYDQGFYAPTSPYGQNSRQYQSPYGNPYQMYDPFADLTPYRLKERKSKWKKWIVLGILLAIAASFAAYIIYSNGSRRAIAGLPDPVQTQASGGDTKVIDGYDVDITYRYAYSVDALVVHTKSYSGSGLGDKLSPVDLGLAWGDVAANNTNIDFHWSQRGRWIYWEVDNVAELAPIGGLSEVNKQCSNNHIIPATSSVKEKVKKIRRGDRVRLEGYLVDIYGEKPDGAWFEWRTSTSREDSGDGACEVFYVTKAEIVD